MSGPENPQPLILFVDDEATAVKYFQRAIDSMAAVETACSVEDGKQLLDRHHASLRVLVSDQRMPGGYGNELLAYAREHHPHVVRILTTAYSEIDHTVEAVNQGHIHRYIQKPWDISALRMELKQALEWAELQRQHRALLEEKMTVQQRQVLANRIASLHAFGACLTMLRGANPAPTALRAAAAAGVTLPKAQAQTDYAETVGAEAVRAGQFGRALTASLAVIRQRYRNCAPEEGLTLLTEVLGATVAPEAGGVLIQDRRLFAEYLDAPVGATVSARHVAWLAVLTWMHEHGQCVEVTPQDEGGAMQCRLRAGGTAFASLDQAPGEAADQGAIAAWVEHFCVD